VRLQKTEKQDPRGLNTAPMILGVPPLPIAYYFIWAMGAISVAFTCVVMWSLRLTFLTSPALYVAVASLVFAFAVSYRSLRERGLANSYVTALKSTIGELDAARNEAEASNKAKTRFLATISHEIRTPMNGIIGMNGLLLETKLTAEQANYVKAADAAGRTLTSIIDELLDTSKIEAGRLELERLPFDILSVAEGVIELLAPRAHAKSIEISSLVDADVPGMIIGDQHRVRQILFNLCGNAIKFTEAGGVALCVAYDDQREEMLIKVKDSGIGMTAAELGRIFEDYVQANSGTARKFGGTGLGLSISKNLADSMGGSIGVSSSIGVGTEFVVTLPAKPEGQTYGFLKPLAGRHYKLAFADGPTLHHLATTLRGLGAGVDVLANAKDVTKELRTTHAGCALICDTSYADQLRTWARRQKRKSGQAMQVWVAMLPEHRRSQPEFLRAPFAGYLLKPMRRQTIVNQLTAQDNHALRQAVKQLQMIVKPAGATRQLRILLAEDNPINALLAKTILKKAGHSVHHVTSGAEFVSAWQDKPIFDLGILDIEMPDMNGYETAAAVRKQEAAGKKRPRLPILALTANANEASRQACFKAGMDGHLSKPFERHDLDEAIAGLTAARRAA
jgi:signal transduction histidine kinase/CheY-like chemotaxis protein